jgi:hypothetical protein
MLVSREVRLKGDHIEFGWFSLVWFFVLTAVGTILGGIAYAYLQSYLPNLPASTTATNVRAGTQLQSQSSSTTTGMS